MSFLIQQVSLEAELQMNVSEPVSSTPTTAPTNSSGFHSAAAQPSSCPARTFGLLQSSQPDAAADKVPTSSLEPRPQRASYRSSSSRLRLPALPPGSARSPRISARYPGLQASGGAAKEVEPSSGGLTLPAGFVSTGDLEEDTQQLLEMDSEVYTSLHFLPLCLLSLKSENVYIVPYCTVCIAQFYFCAASQLMEFWCCSTFCRPYQLLCCVAMRRLLASSFSARIKLSMYTERLCTRQPGSGLAACMTRHCPTHATLPLPCAHVRREYESG